MSKRKNVSLLVSAVGWIGSFVGELIPALRERGIPDEEIHAYVTEGGKAPVGKIADVLAEAIRQAKNIFWLTMNQYKTTEEAVAAGKYDHTNPSINSLNFPLRRPRIKGSREIVLLEFDYDPDPEQVFAEAKKQGLKSPDYEDVFDFGEQFPKVQRKFPVVFLHEPWRNPHGYLHGYLDVMVLGSDSSGRNLDLYSFRRRWDRCCRFAFVCK